MANSKPTSRLRDLICEIADIHRQVDKFGTWEQIESGDKDVLKHDKELTPILSKLWFSYWRLTNFFSDSGLNNATIIRGLDKDSYDLYQNLLLPRWRFIRSIPLLFLEFYSYSDIFSPKRHEIARRLSVEPHTQVLKQDTEDLLDFILSNDHFIDSYLLSKGLDIEDDFYDIKGDLEMIYGMIKSPFYQPDLWRSNLNSIRPVVFGRRFHGISKRLKRRLNDMYQAFWNGQYIATIALARALLEYCLNDYFIHRPARNDWKNPGRPELQELIHAYSQKEDHPSFPRLDEVRDCGNAIMHPNHPQADIATQQLESRERSIRVISTVVDTMEVVYRP